MNRRERMWRAQHFQTPDWLPLVFNVYGGLIIKEGRRVDDLMRQYDFDTGPVDIQIEDEGRDLDAAYKTEDVDDWGVGWRHIKECHLGSRFPILWPTGAPSPSTSSLPVRPV